MLDGALDGVPADEDGAVGAAGPDEVELLEAELGAGAEDEPAGAGEGSAVGDGGSSERVGEAVSVEVSSGSVPDADEPVADVPDGELPLEAGADTESLADGAGVAEDDAVPFSVSPEPGARDDELASGGGDVEPDDEDGVAAWVGE